MLNEGSMFFMYVCHLYVQPYGYADWADTRFTDHKQRMRHDLASRGTRDEVRAPVELCVSGGRLTR